MTPGTGPRVGPADLLVDRIRDLTLVTQAGLTWVIACDSLGGIGPKSQDTVSVSARVSAHFATRVPLLEVICAGAEPVVIVNALCVEAEPTGAEMMAEVLAVAARLGLGPERVTGSTEDNVTTVATGIGVTVLGRRGAAELPRPGGARAGDLVLCVGLPRSAPRDRITIGHPDLASIEGVAAALRTGLVHDALPVGSHGIGHELALLASTAGLRVAQLDHDLDLTRSGGPSSCVLLALEPDQQEVVRASLGSQVPVTALARLLDSVPLRAAPEPPDNPD